MSFEVEMKRPTPAAVDALIEEYADAQALAAAAGDGFRVANELASRVKERLVPMVLTFGVPHAKKSMRLCGTRNTATTTTATPTVIVPGAVETFRTYLEKKALPILGMFFIAHTTYTLVAAPAEVLKTLNLRGKVLAKMKSLIGLCHEVKTNAPSLKVDVVEPTGP